MQATDELSVTLTAAEWNQAIAILGEGPFRVVAPILGKIHAQAQAQGALGAPAAAVPDVSRETSAGNGAAIHGP